MRYTVDGKHPDLPGLPGDYEKTYREMMADSTLMAAFNGAWPWLHGLPSLWTQAGVPNSPGRGMVIRKLV